MPKVEIPQQYKDLVGTEQVLTGPIFSPKKRLKKAVYEVRDIRLSDATIMNMDTKKKHPAFELCVKSKKMERARWTRPFPIRELELSRKVLSRV